MAKSSSYYAAWTRLYLGICLYLRYNAHQKLSPNDIYFPAKNNNCGVNFYFCIYYVEDIKWLDAW